jgi:hypothetical protein
MQLFLVIEFLILKDQNGEKLKDKPVEVLIG